MFVLNGVEIAHFAVAAVGAALALIAMRQNGYSPRGLTAVVCAFAIPVFGPLLAFAYGVLTLRRVRRSRTGGTQSR